MVFCFTTVSGGNILSPSRSVHGAIQPVYKIQNFYHCITTVHFQPPFTFQLGDTVLHKQINKITTSTAL